MATEQVLSWIQNDLKLSQVVSNFETDFSNGYLLGEILDHYQVLDKNQFTNKKSKEAKVNNFYLIEDALRKIKVKFDGKMMHQIMEEERGVVLRLLYQIKLSCQRMNRVELEDDPDLASMTNLKNGIVHKITEKKQKEVLELSKYIKPPTVGGKDVRTNKQKLQDQRTIAFEVKQKQLFEAAQAAHQAEMTLIQSITQEQRNLNQTKLLENQTFMKEWIAEGKEQWKLNQEKRVLAIQKVKYFEDREVNIYKNKLQTELTGATNEMNFGISDFEKNLQKLGIQQNISMADAVKRMEEKKGIPPGQIQNFSYAATMNKIKETKKNSDFAGKERDRRRRKMMVDQVNAQAILDGQQQEELLIQRLLTQTQKEQEEAYIDIRTILCKERDFQQRYVAATTLEEKLRIQNEQTEHKRKFSVKEVEEERKRLNEARRVEMKKQHFQNKLQTRSLNIEIASGLVDLILDLSEETFDVVVQNQDHQIPKPEWRNFLEIFKQGKKVSLRNITQEPAKQEVLQQDDNLQIGKDTQAHDILKLFAQEKSLVSLYDYITCSSQFDFTKLRSDLWNQFERLYKQNDAYEQIVPFLDTKLQNNSELVKTIDTLYQQIGDRQSPDNEQTNSQLAQELSFKIALLGGGYSGKKTIAKQIIEQLGPDVVIFNMNDIIKEAIDYISPKKTEEVVVDPKAKGKSKQAEQVVVDIFEGKNVQKYKQIAQQIKDQYLAGEQLPRKTDLIDLVLDDSLLTSLFIERMRLQFEGKQLSKSVEEIKAGLIREQEIVKQLEDLEQQAAMQASDPKAKGGAKPSKGGPDPEKLAAELEDVRKFKPVGWVLLDYPKTLNQIKLLETELSGFVSKVDQQKSEKVEIEETWNKLVINLDESVQEVTPTIARQSGFDALLILSTSADECIRRSSGRKIDPNTQIVYNPGELPTDPKTVERLQDFNDEAGETKRISQTHELFNKRIVSVKKWTEQFGLVNQEGQCVVTLGQDIYCQNWTSKDAVKESVLSSVKSVLAFKQLGYDSRRQAVRINLSAQTQSQEEIKMSNTQKSAQDFLDEVRSQNVSQVLSTNKPLSVTEDVKKMSETIGGGASSYGGTTNKSTARRKNQQRFEINDVQKINHWEDMLNTYFRENMKSFTSLSKQRRNILELYSQTQTQFIEYICRETPYQKRVTEFIESFNRFSEEYPDLRTNPETKVELLKRVTILSNQLWDQILDRKNQAVEKRQQVTKEMQQGWSTHEICKLISFIAQLIQNEFERLRTVVAVTTGWVWNEDVDLVQLCFKLDERAIQTFQKGSNDQPTSPMLDQIISYVQQMVFQLLQEQFVSQADQHVLNMILTERTNFNMRCNTLRVYALALLEEINDQTDLVSDAFQGWIISSVKKENTVCQAIVNQIKKHIEAEASYIAALTIENPRLDRLIERVDLKGAIVSKMNTGSQMSTIGPADRRFDINTLRLLYQKFQQSANEQLLESQTFLTIMIRSYQNRLVPKIFAAKSFKIIVDLATKYEAKPLTNEAEGESVMFASSNETQSGNSVNFVNWKKILILFVLYSTALPTEEDLQKVEIRLVKHGSTVSKKEFSDTEMWFDERESASYDSKKIVQELNSDEDEDNSDYIRLQQVKELLWLTVKRTNENGMRVSDFLGIIRNLADSSETQRERLLNFGELIEY